MNARIFILGLALAMLLPGSVQARDAASGMVMVHDGWIRTAPPTAPVRAGYGMLMSHGTAEVVIDAVRSEAFERVEIHEMHEVDGVMRMRPVRELHLAPFQTVQFKPGGMHLMLFGPKPSLQRDGGAEIVFLQGNEEVVRARFQIKDGAPDDAEHEHAH